MATFYIGGCLLFPVVIVLLLYFYSIRNNNYWQKKNVPFLKPLPIFGNVKDAIMMRTCMAEIFHDFYQKAKTPVVGFFILDRPCLLIRDLQIVKRILVTDFQYFFDRNIMSNKRDDPVSAHFLFVIKNPEWRELRPKVSPFFTTSKIKMMSILIEEVANKMTSYLKEKIKSTPIVDMKDTAIRFTVDVITSTAFGVNPDSFKHESSRFCLEAKKMFNHDNIVTSFRLRCYFLAHTLVKLFRMTMLNPEAINFLAESFNSVWDMRASGRDNFRNDLIDILLQLDENDEFYIEKDKLISQAVMFFTAGFETSSSTIGFGLHELAHHPEIQTKLRQEINKVSEQHGGINYESLKEMEYLEMCIKETLRKYPVLSFMDRKCNSSYTIPETGTKIVEGTAVFISVFALHYDPQYFPDPEVFDPERFSQENKHKIESFSYLPFGEGPRNCVGARFGMLTVKFGLAHILKNFTAESCAGSSKKIKFSPNDVLLSALEGINIKLQEIKN